MMVSQVPGADLKMAASRTGGAGQGNGHADISGAALDDELMDPAFSADMQQLLGGTGSMDLLQDDDPLLRWDTADRCLCARCRPCVTALTIAIFRTSCAWTQQWLTRCAASLQEQACTLHITD